MFTKLNYAGFWLRFVAYIIDGVAIGIVSGIIGSILPDLGNVLAIGIGAGYFIYFESSEYQGTLGKMALGIKVTDLKGARITPATAAIRYIGKILSAIILCIGFIMAAFTEKKQGLHDIIAGTLVVLKSKGIQEVDVKEVVADIKADVINVVSSDKASTESGPVEAK